MMLSHANTWWFTGDENKGLNASTSMWRNLFEPPTCVGGSYFWIFHLFFELILL